MKVNGFEDEGFDPKDWHVDLQTDYVTHFPTDTGFSVGYSRAADFGRKFIAEPVHFPVWGEVPTRDELARLCRIAVRLFALHFRARQRKLTARHLDHHSITEDSIHEKETRLRPVLRGQR